MTTREYNAGGLFLASIHDRKAYFFVGDSECLVMSVTARELKSFDAFRAKVFDTFGLWCFKPDKLGYIGPFDSDEWHKEIVRAANSEPPTDD